MALALSTVFLSCADIIYRSTYPSAHYPIERWLFSVILKSNWNCILIYISKFFHNLSWFKHYTALKWLCVCAVVVLCQLNQFSWSSTAVVMYEVEGYRPCGYSSDCSWAGPVVCFVWPLLSVASWWWSCSLEIVSTGRNSSFQLRYKDCLLFAKLCISSEDSSAVLNFVIVPKDLTSSDC